MTSKENQGDMTPLREAAVSAHEMYTAYRDAGFSRGEAIELVARLLSNMLSDAIAKGDFKKPPTHD